VKMELESLPQDIDRIERRTVSLEIERQALKKEEDEISRKRLGEVEKEIAELREQASGMKAKWMNEKEVISRLRELKGRIEELRIEYEQAERAGSLDRAAEIRFGILPQAEKELAATQ